MHAAMGQLNLPTLLHQACDVDSDPVLTPAQTYQKLIRNGTEKVRIPEMAGRLAGVMLVPYPPGIPVRMPGERLGDLTVPSFVFCWRSRSSASSFLDSSARSMGLKSMNTAITGCAVWWRRRTRSTPGTATVRLILRVRRRPSKSLARARFAELLNNRAPV